MGHSQRRCGAVVQPDGSVKWRVWAPQAKSVELVLLDGIGLQVVRMDSERDGYFSHVSANVRDSQQYFYRLDGGDNRQDPCSLFQPDGVGQASAVYDPGHFSWTDESWRGVRREDLVFYEIHVGTFTPEGTFESIIPRLQTLRELGVTAIEIMPVAQFPGSRNWGYDGVLPYAAQNTYGGPVGLQKLVDAAHAAGLAVVLDVVYNHLGPEGNYLHEFGPYFTDKYKTPWGKAINYDDRGCDGVRDWVLDNVRMWLAEFHLDGLRLDAVHSIFDMGARHILRAIKEVAEEVAQETDRVVHIVAESDLNDPRILHSPERGGHGIDAQWSDDFHHAVHALLTGESRGYYEDYGKPQQLAEVMNDPFLFAWTHSPGRGRKHGAPAGDLSGDRFVVCIQNHDQVGNRAEGDRLGTILKSPAKQRLAACLMLFSPHLPLLFMGEEYGEKRPFPFFCSFCGDELIEAVREGRKREFAHFFHSADEVPDPHSKSTFDAAKLSWSWPDGTFEGGLRRMYADALAARRRWMAMGNFTRRSAKFLPDSPILHLIRGGADSSWQGTVHAFYNLGERPFPIAADLLGASEPLFASEAHKYGGPRECTKAITEILPFECAVFGPPDGTKFV